MAYLTLACILRFWIWRKCLLQVLPSSESGAERVFARMRDIFHKKQTHSSPKSLRTNLIVSFYVDQESPEEFYDNCDNWLLNKEEEEAIECDYGFLISF